MAANIPQMGGGGPNTPAVGWHTSVSPNMRVGHAMNIITNAFLAMPTAENPGLVSTGLQYEREAFTKCPDKASYEAAILERVNELFKKRQANEQNIHNTLNAQAAARAQNQSQMMMSQNMQMGRMGQPLQQGFQNLQQQMQPARINQQGQSAIGMSNVNGLPMNPNQQVMQMGTQMRPQLAMQSGMANLSPQDRLRVNQYAIAKFNAVPEPTRSQYRAAIQQKFGPHVVAQLQQDNVDPLVYYFQSQIIQNLSKGQAGVNQAGMPMQAHQQQSMNQPVQQLAAGPNGEFGPLANVESIMNQQKAGLMAQEAGQMVVPASNGTGRNATPQPIGSMPGPNQGAGQPTMSHQLPQQFNHQPAQQLKMDQRAAQTQAQIRAQAQAKQMQGQPGGLNGPGGASQSPAMNTLNAPVRRTPIGVGQTEGHPQMGQGNVPFGQMDPRFTQTGQRTPMGPNRNQLLHGILQQMPAEYRQQVLSQPQEKAAEMILRWNAARTTGPMAGRPQGPIGQLGPGNPVTQSMNQFAPGSNGLGQHPNLGMTMNQQNQFLMQQQMNKLRNANAPQGPVDRNALMDNMGVPQKILESLRLSQGGVSPDVKKWGQLKQWMAQKNMAQQHVNQLLGFQNAQFQSYLKSNPAFAAANLQLAQSNMQHPAMPLNGQVTPQMGQPTSNVAGSNPNITVTPQELQSAKNHERFKGLPDEKLRQMLFTMKLQAMKNRATGQMPGPPAQAPQVPQPGHTTTAPSPSQLTHGVVAPQRQQNSGPETSAASPTVQGRNSKQSQNSRAAPTVPATTTAKTGTKRPHPDDTPEVPNPSATPVPRQQPQQPQVGASSIPPQMPQASPEQLAAMSTEQRQKYEAMVKSRQAAPAGQLSEEMLRLKTIGQEISQSEWKEHLPDIPMSPEQFRDTAHKIQALAVEMTKMSKLLTRWYAFARDDGRASLFFKLRTRLIKQFSDNDKMTILKDKFSIPQTDLDGMRVMLEGMGKDLTAHYTPGMRKNPSQQNAPEPTPPQGVSTRQGAPAAQPAPLNAANLEKQTQALNRMHQRNNSRAGQPPPPPTTAQPPFSFGAQSPDGQPTYAGNPKVTQDNLQLPARKKPKTEVKAGAGPNQNGSSANASPQGQKLSSPEMSKRQAATEARSTKSQFRCVDQYCDFRSIGFPTPEALYKHTQEEHVKPAENPMKFAVDGLAEVLGLDANGKPKAVVTAGANAQSPGDASKHAQTPPIKAEPVNARDVSMKRQSSMTGSKPNELIKTIAGKAGTPKPDSSLKAVDGATPVAVAANGGAALQAAIDEPMSTTIDPQELLSAVTGLETGGNGAILDMNVYRSLTPNDTPESSKDSAASELNSDVSEGVALNVTLDMGFGTWDPFALGHEPPTLDLENYDSMPAVPYPDFSWDEVNTDFDKPFALDTSFFSLEAS
ncbi:hypothetical protein CIB48_g8765 [Xylaria polymorpha]|nr:hypothetical protein CIB48_g8765 [Xylaria polymorpha]